MTQLLLRRLLHVLPLVALTGGVSLAQPGQFPPPRPGLPAVPALADKDDIEVLARGPIHEAYAATAEMPTGGPVVDQRPPDPVEELPPDQKPDGENVQWMPGYWHFDEERKDFIWISGFWRDAPPGRVWVPGGWQEVRNGFQWVSGFWNVPAPAAQPGVAPQTQLEYLPPPPATLETGPTLVSPGDDHFYTPGCWVYRVNRYVWRPGFWVAHRPNWVWVPDQYRWTPCGFVFVPGYWDVPLERRGVLFAPVFFRPAVVLRPRFVYTPVYAVPAPCLHTSLFVRTGFSNYYFGDFFEPRYATAGFNSWAVGIRGSNFAVTASGGRGFAYDPLWSYYSVAFRREPAWQRNIANVYTGRFNGTVPRPPRTLVHQNTIINNTTVVNSNTTVINNNSNNTTTRPTASPVMLAPLADLKKDSPTVALKPVAVEDRTKEQQAAKELRQVAADRRRAEAQLVARGQVPTKADDKPQQVKVDLSKTAVARAQQPPPKEKAPPPAPTPVMKKPESPTAPPTGVKPGAKPTVPTVPPMNDPTKGPPAKVDRPVKPNDPPKTGPGAPMPPIGPKPNDPKPPVNPPKNDPPKGPPANPPKVDLPKPGNPLKGPPKTDPPKVNPPKGPTVPPVGPKPGDPPKPKDPPKTDPPKGPTIPPVTPPVGPKPKDPPKGPPVNPPTLPPVGPKPNNPPKGPPPKADPPKSGPGNPMPPVVSPKAPPPRVNPPKPQPPVAPPPKVDPPKSPVSNPPPKSPASPPPKVDPPKSNPPKGPGVPTRPTRGDDKKDDKKRDERK